MATNFLNDDIYYQQREEDPFDLFSRRPPDKRNRETNPHRNLRALEEEERDDVIIIDDDTNQQLSPIIPNRSNKTTAESTSKKEPSIVESDEMLARKLQEKYDRELAEAFNRREANRIVRASNHRNNSSSNANNSSRTNRLNSLQPVVQIDANGASGDDSVLLETTPTATTSRQANNPFNRNGFVWTSRKADDPSTNSTSSIGSSTSRFGGNTTAAAAAAASGTTNTGRIPESIQDDIMYSMARSSNQINSADRHYADPSPLPPSRSRDGASQQWQQPPHQDVNDLERVDTAFVEPRMFTRSYNAANAASTATANTNRNNNFNHMTSSRLPNRNSAASDPVHNLASAFSILNNDEMVNGIMDDMRREDDNSYRQHHHHSNNSNNHRISQFQPHNHYNQAASYHDFNHHQQQLPQQRRQRPANYNRYNNNFNRSEFMPHSRLPTSSIALRVSMNNRDFTPDDYETLLRLDEINGVKKVLSKSEIDSLPCFSYKQADEASANAESDKSCSICYEDYVPREKIMALTCTHKFHKKCIQKWLQESRRCPLCQKDAINGE